MSVGGLFLAHIYVDGCATEVPVLAYFVFKVATVGLFYPLGKVAEEYEGGYGCTFEHGDVFDLYVFAFVGRRWIRSYGFLHHGVEL